MKLRRPAVLAVLAAAAGVSYAGAAPSPVLAAPSTCQGKAVTIVATTGVTRGTEGVDVVAMEPGGWNRFDALGGDDTVCLAPGAASDQHEAPPPGGWLDAGAGNDVVVNPTPEGTNITVVLGHGSDTYQGAGVGERVHAEKESFLYLPDVVDEELVGQQRDVITGAGTVYSAAPLDGPNADRITLSGPQVRAVLDGPFGPDGLLDVAAGSSDATLELRTLRRLGSSTDDLLIDNRSRTVSAGPPVISWSGVFSTFVVGTPSRDVTTPAVSFTGTDAAERVIFSGVPVGDVALGGGTDALELHTRRAVVPRSADGGAGQDSALFKVVCRRVLDVRIDRFAVCDEESGSFTGYENVLLAAGLPGVTTTLVTLVGTSRSELLVAEGDSVVVRGGAGRDTVEVSFDRSARVSAGAGHDHVAAGHDSAAAGRDDLVLRGQGGDDRLVLQGAGTLKGPQIQRVARGGRGDDVLLGGTDGRPDRLVGGPGRDRADGRQGSRDVCSAEVTRRCERP